MKVTYIAFLSLFASLPFLSVAEGYKSYQDAKHALELVCVEGDFEKARPLAEEVRRLAGDNAVRRADVDRQLVQWLARFGRNGEILEIGVPAFLGCTNYTTLAPVRHLFFHTAKAALAEGKADLFRTMVERLAEEPLTPPSFECWRNAYQALIEDAVAQRRKPAAEQREQAEKLRGGGSTFGIWQVPLVIDGRLAFDKLRLAEGENLLMKVMPREGLTPELRYRRDLLLFDGEQRIGDEEGKEKAYRRIKDFALTFAPADPAGTNLVHEAMAKCCDFHEKRLEWARAIDLAKEFASKRAAFLGEDAILMEGRELGYLFRSGATEAFEAKEKEFSGKKVTKATFDAYMACAKIIRGRHHLEGRKEAARFLEPLYRQRARLREEERIELLEFLVNVAFVTKDVPGMKSYYKEIVKIVDDRNAEIEEDLRLEREARAKKEPYRRKDLRRLRVVPGVYFANGNLMLDEHEIDEAVAAWEDIVKKEPARGWCHVNLAKARIWAGQREKCAEELSSVVTNARFQTEERFNGQVLLASVTARDEADFVARVKAALPYDDQEKNFDILLAGTYCLLQAGASQSEIGRILALQELAESMKHPERRVRYTARFLADAPRSAGDALRSGLFEKLPAGDVFFPYGIYSSIEKGKAKKLLSCHPEPPLTKTEPERSGRVAVAYDETGVHLYIRLNDPKAAETLAGLNDGASYEITVMPGEMTQYNQIFGNARDTVDRQEIEWDSPRPGHRLTRDSIKTDSLVTRDCYVFHTFIPWVMYYTRLPEDGGTWRFVIGCSWDGEFRMAGGGHVHELGRGLQVVFEIPAAAREAIRAGLVKSAVGEYRRVRGKWESADFWADPHLGDPAFYDQVVKPLLEELDKEADAAVGGPLGKEEVDRHWKDHLPKWIDFRLYLDGLRVAYLKDRFFVE